MFNTKTVLAIALTSALSFTASANETLALDFDDLHASINAELTQGMEDMQKAATASTNLELKTETKQEVETVQLSLAD
ncbi:hypothetical protein [Shewanella maritima]|uniref:hypothetical protein n=1 Tax=Shewanella maritima TaxID=2520507 RepID=UPI0037359C9F